MSSSKEISAQNAAVMVENEDVQLIDVRRQEEWDGARLGGARHIELELLTSKASEIDKDTPVVFYCHTGVRSQMAADAFAASGYDAYNLVGGIKAWVGADLPVDPPGAEIVH